MKQRTDLCTFKRFLKKHGVLKAYKADLRYQKQHGLRPLSWSDIAKRSQAEGLYNIIDQSLLWSQTQYLTRRQCCDLNKEWNKYWIEYCSALYKPKTRNQSNSSWFFI